MSKYKVVYQMKKLQNVSKFENISILWLENKSESSLERKARGSKVCKESGWNLAEGADTV